MIRSAALLLHPILASLLLGWVWWQYSWRKKSYELKGEERQNHLEKHQEMGEKFLLATFAVVIVAFLGRMVAGWSSSGDIFAEIWPTNIHGFTGPIGLLLLWQLTRMGRQTKTAKENGGKFNTLKIKHGRMADMMMILIFIHAFMGFLYTFAVLS